MAKKKMFSEKTVWLTGSEGMLGKELFLLLEKSSIPFLAADREVDITKMAEIEDFAERHPVAWIINCAAYTAVDKAEDDSETCRRINRFGAANLAKYAEKRGARFIHISTDYVFDGKGITAEGVTRPYREDDETNPSGIYGLSKRDGEIAVTGFNSCSYIIRTAWLYGKHGNNFVHTMLRLMSGQDEIKIVNDQRGSPTWAGDLASVILTIIETVNSGKNIPFGIYHYTNEGNITWYDFAKEIYRQGREFGLIKKDCVIKPCSSAEYPTKAKRPAYSVLDKSKIKTALEIEIPAWDASLREFLQDNVKPKS